MKISARDRPSYSPRRDGLQHVVGRLVVLLEPREELADPLVVAEFVGAGECRHRGPQIVDVGGADDLPGEGDSQAAVRLLAAVVTDATFVELLGVGEIEDGELERGRGPEQGDLVLRAVHRVVDVTVVVGAVPAEVAVLVGVAGDEGTLGKVEPRLVAAGVVGAVQPVIEEHGETADGDADGEGLADLAVDAGRRLEPLASMGALNCSHSPAAICSAEYR